MIKYVLYSAFSKGFWTGKMELGARFDRLDAAKLFDTEAQLLQALQDLRYGLTCSGAIRKVHILEEPSRLEECELGREDGWVLKDEDGSYFSSIFSTPTEALRFVAIRPRPRDFATDSLVPVRRVPGGTRIEEINE